MVKMPIKAVKENHKFMVLGITLSITYVTIDLYINFTLY